MAALLPFQHDFRSFAAWSVILDRLFLGSLPVGSIPFTVNSLTNKQCHEKTCLQGFRKGPTQNGLYNHRRWLEASNLVYMKEQERDCKTKALISCRVNCAVTAQLICAFVFHKYNEQVFSRRNSNSLLESADEIIS